MIDLGLTPAEQRAFEAALRSSHDIRVGVQVLDADEQPLADLPVARVLEGAVQYDADADVTRSLSLTLLDPTHTLQFDSNSPADGAIYAQNHLAVRYGVWVAELERWVDVPVFSGPLTQFEHDGPEVHIEAQGKETLGLDPHFVVYGYTLPQGTTIADAVAAVMGRVGERRHALTMLEGTLRTSRSVTPAEAPWQVCVGGGVDGEGADVPALVAKSDGTYALFYDGRGILTGRPLSRNGIWVFDENQLTSRPGYTYDMLEFRNHAEVTGNLVTGSYSLPAEHPLSPASLARNGEPRYMSIFYESDTLTTRDDCQVKARTLVEAAAYQGVTARFETLPVPHLEERDNVVLSMPDYGLTFQLRQWTLPLTAGTPMSVGFLRQLRRPLTRGRSFVPITGGGTTVG